MNHPLIITVAVVGGELTRKDTPYVPFTPEEIAKECVAVRRLGAQIVHLHARDTKGIPKHEVGLFREITGEISNRCKKEKLEPPIFQFSTGGSIGMNVQERMGPLALDPEMASLTTGSVNFGKDIFENSRETMETIAKELKKRGVGIEIEVFDGGMIDNALSLVKDGVLQEPLHFNFVLGVPGGLGATPENLFFLIGKLPADSTWAVAGIGRHQLPMAAHAIASGGHVRVGLEDNIYLRKGELAKGNAPLVERMIRLAEVMERPVATMEQVRSILRLKRNEKRKVKERAK